MEPKILRRRRGTSFRRRNCRAVLYDWRFSVAIVTARSLIRTKLNKQDATVLENQKLQL
jgi:hypothetical protein